MNVQKVSYKIIIYSINEQDRLDMHKILTDWIISARLDDNDRIN